MLRRDDPIHLVEHLPIRDETARSAKRSQRGDGVWAIVDGAQSGRESCPTRSSSHDRSTSSNPSGTATESLSSPVAAAISSTVQPPSLPAHQQHVPGETGTVEVRGHGHHVGLPQIDLEDIRRRHDHAGSVLVELDPVDTPRVT